MTRALTIATYNIHKGLSPLNRKLVIHDVRKNLHALDADLVFLQEVQGAHQRHQARFADWPGTPQHEHIAEGRYRDLVYAANAAHAKGHHGNALLSAWPVLDWANHDVSHHRFENRGHLVAQIEVPGWSQPLTCVCVHLGLLQRSRQVQIASLVSLLQSRIDADAPLVVAGDFNDWRAKRGGVSNALKEGLGLHEVFESVEGKPARTFPAIFPLLTLDRIYVRGLKVESVLRLRGDVEGGRWRGLSDHMGIAVKLSR